MHNTNTKGNKLLDMIFQGQAQFHFLSWKKSKRKEGLNLHCLILAHPIMKKYPCTLRDHLPGQGPSQLHQWSQTKKGKHRGLGKKSLPVVYLPFRIIPLT